METSKTSSSYTSYAFAWDEFLDKLGLPRDANVLQVRIHFEAGKSFEVIAKDGD